MARPESIAKAGFYATPERVAHAIARHIARPQGDPTKDGFVRLIDPCCGEGVAAEIVANSLGAQAYGIELEGARARTASPRFDHFMHCGAEQVRLANGAFSVLYLNPPYDYDEEKKRAEHAFLTSMTRALAPGGLLVFIVPKRRLAVSARYLAGHYTGMRVYRFPDPEWDLFGQVVLFGIKRSKNVSDPKVAEKIAAVSEPMTQIEPLPDHPWGDEAPYTATPVQPGDILFAPLYFDPHYTMAEAQKKGVWSLPGLRDRLWPVEQKGLRPLMGLRKGHIAQLIASGFLDQIVLEHEGSRVLVKGRAKKEFVKVKSDTEGTTIEREVVKTTVTVLDLDTGVSREIGHGAGLAEFIQEYAEPITKAVIENYPPVYTSKNRAEWGYDLTQLKRPPLGAQGDAIRACAVSLERQRGTTVSGVMGTGKSYVGCSAAWYATLKLPQVASGKRHGRIVIVCPPHLVEKWKREVEITIPNATGRVVRTITDLQAAMTRPTRGPLYVIISRERAKLSYYWEPAVMRKKAMVVNQLTGWKEPAETLCCPDCGKEIMDRKEDLPIEYEVLQKRRHVCDLCGGKLFGAIASPPKTGRGRFTFGGAAAPHTKREGVRRYAVADYIGRHCKGYFDICIVDEVHEMKAKGSAQGIAAAVIAESAGKVISLTGTLFGGYSSTLFYLLYRFTDKIRGDFGYEDERLWLERYGIVERTTKENGEESSSGKTTRSKGYTTREQEKPGLSPAALVYLLEQTVFLKLEDVARDLPPYDELIRLTPMTAGQTEKYKKLEREVGAAVRTQLAMGNKGLLSAYLQALLSWPDASHKEETVVDKQNGYVVSSVEGEPEDEVFPKEQDLVDLAVEQKREGRRVLCYITHTNKRDISPRLKVLLEEAGLRVAILRSTTVPSEKREEWVNARVAEGLDVLIAHPKLVQTGLDLIDFAEIVFYEPEYSVYVMRQASRRSWRIGQTQPVRVHFWVYDHTMQKSATTLVAAKLKSAVAVDGDLAEDGLAAMNDDSGDVMLQLAKQLSGEMAEHADSLETLFAQAKEADFSRNEFLAGDDGFTAEDWSALRKSVQVVDSHGTVHETISFADLLVLDTVRRKKAPPKEQMSFFEM